MDKRVLLSCPVSNRAWVIPYYLDSIHNLDYDKKLIDIYWIINNSTDQSFSLLKQFKKQHQNEYNSITIEEYNNHKLPKDERVTSTRIKIYPWLAHLRNKILQKAVSLNVDYLYSSDCDIILQPNSLKRLLFHDKDIVANLIYNGFLYIPPNSLQDYNPIENAHKFPNVLREIAPRQYQHITNYHIKYPDKNPTGTLLECEFSGASILISKEVCKVTKYDTNLTYGEDEPWSYSARQAGYKIYCDISSYQKHIMSPEILDLYLKGKI